MKRVFTNAMISSARRPAMFLITIVLTPFVLHHLGKEAYGIWALTGSVLAYTGLLKLGLNSVIDYQLPRLVEKNDTAGVNKVVSSVFAMYSVAALVACAFVVVLTWQFPDWFRIPLEYHAEARWVVALVGVGVVAQIPLSVYTGVLAGLQRYDVQTGVYISTNVGRAVGVVVLLSLGTGLVGLAAISVLAQFVGALWLMWSAHRLYPSLALGRGSVDRTILPSLTGYSMNTLMWSAGQILMLQSGKTLAGLLYGPEAVTDFAIPFMLLMVVGQAVAQAARTVKPATSQLDAQDRGEAIRRMYLLTTKYTLLITVPTCVVFMLHADTILKAWVGAAFTGQSAVLLMVLTVPQMIRVTQLGGFFVLSGLGQHRVFGALSLTQSLSAIVLGYVLAEPFGLGLLGVALGISLPELIGSGVILPLYCAGRLKLRLLDQLRECLAPALLATVPLFIYCLAVRLWLQIETRAEFVLVFGASVLPFAAGIWFLGIGRRERDVLKGYGAPALRILRARRAAR